MRSSVVALVAILLFAPVAACAEAPVKLSLDWVFDGTTAEVLQADANGYFRDEGIAATIDRGYGAGDTISRVASGAYQFAIGDVTALIEYNAGHPDDPLVAVMMLYDKSAFAIITTADRGINSIADLKGRQIGALTGETMSRLFPALAARNGLDPATAPLQNVSGQIRDTLLRTGKVDAVIGFFTTTKFNLETNGVPPDQVRYFKYTDHGLDLYGSAIIAKASYVAENPKVVAGVVRALTRGLIATAADPAAAIAPVKLRNPLIDPEIELRRLNFTLDQIVLTPYVRTHGVGGIDEARLAQHIDLVTKALALPSKPSVASIFNPAFLPPAGQRQVGK